MTCRHARCAHPKQAVLSGNCAWGIELAASHCPELAVACLLAAQLDHIPGNHEISRPELLLLAGDPRFLRDLFHVVAFHDIKSVGLLQMCNQDGLGMSAKTVHAVREQAA